MTYAQTDGRILFVEAVESTDDACGADLWSIGADGGGLRRLTVGSALECSPCWSPDGRWIAFARCHPGTDQCEIWRADAEASAEERLDADLPPAVRDLAWSPDGREIAFASTDSVAGGIWVLGPDSPSPRRLVDSAHAGHPSWAPDGTRIAYHDGPLSEVWTIDADGHGASRFLERAMAPSWSPDGTRIALTLWGTDSAPIGIVDVANQEFDVLQATDLIGNVSTRPSWSPDGRRLVYQVGRAEGASLWIIGLDGSEPILLIAGNSPAWAPSDRETAVDEIPWGRAKAMARRAARG